MTLRPFVLVELPEDAGRPRPIRVDTQPIPHWEIGNVLGPIRKSGSRRDSFNAVAKADDEGNCFPSQKKENKVRRNPSVGVWSWLGGTKIEIPAQDDRVKKSFVD